MCVLHLTLRYWFKNLDFSIVQKLGAIPPYLWNEDTVHRSSAECDINRFSYIFPSASLRWFCSTWSNDMVQTVWQNVDYITLNAMEIDLPDWFRFGYDVIVAISITNCTNIFHFTRNRQYKLWRRHRKTFKT